MIYMVILIVAVVSFLLGFFVNILALPYILENFIKELGKYLKCISSDSIFRWSVSLIVSFAMGILVIQFQNERIQKNFEEYYQHRIDSLRWELKIQQVNKLK